MYNGNQFPKSLERSTVQKKLTVFGRWCVLYHDKSGRLENHEIKHVVVYEYSLASTSVWFVEF